MSEEKVKPQKTQELNNGESPKGILEKYPWVVFLLPLIVFMLVGSLEPTEDTPGGSGIGLSIPYQYYPWVYTAKIVLTVLAILFVLPGYRQFPFKVSGLSVLVGVVGVVVWVGLCKLEIERSVLGPLGLGRLIDLGERSGYDPFRRIDSMAGACSFLAVRFFGLAIVVAIIEEFFLRGFVMRFLVEHDWWDVPFGKVNAAAIVAGTAVPMLMHPGELVAAAVWFSMITWLMVRTRNIWDCVAAHAITNCLLGIYVVYSGDWYFM